MPLPQSTARELPATSDLLIIDTRVPLETVLSALAQAGLNVINNRTGKLVVTQRPEDFKAAHT